ASPPLARSGAGGARADRPADAILHLHDLRSDVRDADAEAAAGTCAEVRDDSGARVAGNDSGVWLPLGRVWAPADHGYWLRRDGRLSIPVLSAARYAAASARVRRDRARPSDPGSAVWAA